MPEDRNKFPFGNVKIDTVHGTRDTLHISFLIASDIFKCKPVGFDHIHTHPVHSHPAIIVLTMQKICFGLPFSSPNVKTGHADSFYPHTLALVYYLYKLKNHHHCRVTLALSNLNNSRITALAVHILRCNLVKELCRKVNLLCSALSSCRCLGHLCYRV